MNLIEEIKRIQQKIFKEFIRKYMKNPSKKNPTEDLTSIHLNDLTSIHQKISKESN